MKISQQILTVIRIYGETRPHARPHTLHCMYIVHPHSPVMNRVCIKSHNRHELKHSSPCSHDTNINYCYFYTPTLITCDIFLTRTLSENISFIKTVVDTVQSVFCLRRRCQFMFDIMTYDITGSQLLRSRLMPRSGRIFPFHTQTDHMPTFFKPSSLF